MKTCCPLYMQLAKNYETLYLCSNLDKVIGRRYNIRPDLDEGMDQEIKGYVYRETMTGLFRAWVLNEINLGIAMVVNELLVAGVEQIIKKIGLKEEICLSLIEECVTMGLICENRVIFKDEDDMYFYIVDTGGIFAFEETGIQYKKLAYTTSIDQRLKIYRKNIFLVENNIKQAINLHLFEDTLGMPDNGKYNGATLLVDMKIAERLEIIDYVETELEKAAIKNKARIYDLAEKKYIDK